MRNHSRHYCRHCEEVFEPTSGSHPSAHRFANVHLIVAHDLAPTIQCNKYCLMAEQPEEEKAGRRLYGPGVQPPEKPPIMTYTTLFPEEEDDHS